MVNIWIYIQPIKTEEEIKIDLSSEEKLEIKGSDDIKPNKIFNKLYEVD